MKPDPYICTYVEFETGTPNINLVNLHDVFLTYLSKSFYLLLQTRLSLTLHYFITLVNQKLFLLNNSLILSFIILQSRV